MTTIQQDIETTTDLIPYDETDDGQKHLTHIVNPTMNTHVPGWHSGWMGQDVVDVARLMQIEIVALCGFKFIPVRNPEKFDLCDPCFQIAQNIMREGGE